MLRSRLHKTIWCERIMNKRNWPRGSARLSRAQCLPGYWGGNMTSGVNLLSISNPQGFKNLTPGTGEGLIPIPGGGEWIGQIQEKGDGNIPVMDVPMDAGDFIVEGGENGCRTIGGSGQYQCGLHFHIDPSEEHPHEVK